MHIALVLCSLILAIVSSAAGVPQPSLEYGAPLPQPYQYHSQDDYGQYAYGYAGPLSSKQESRTADGTIRGSYSYRNAHGTIQTVEYIADTKGFHIISSDGPQAKANEETPEVAALRAQHLAAHEEAKLRLAGNSVEVDAGPQPVQDTPEVAAAKVAFFKRYEAEKLRNLLISEKQVMLPIHTVYSQPIYVYQPSRGYTYNRKTEIQRDYLPVA
ncbi:uncharacterized protein Dwil_GK14380 [Drosophila willistoni]|uniref:Cuticle protein 6 n=1 Tax=Drosophila willistoni TaxID=7260 RepID=B4MX78_DROWI|nr:cuticle protein 6 [Drosophila willistoni]EDW76911.1 uncharacterized protein Dwil_GK14380 [Drosophila willistoni]